MIRRLTENDIDLVKSFAYQRERENLFVLGSFETYENTMSENYFLGFFEGSELKGMGTLFNRWGSFIVNAQDPEIIKQLTDEVLKCERKIEFVPYFKYYADVIIERLKSHGIQTKKVNDEVFLMLKKEDFIDLSVGNEGILDPEDLDEYILFHRSIDKEPVDVLVTERERKRITTEITFVLKIGNEIVSTANLHGISNHFFQIGGVATKVEQRGKGYAKQVMSKLCQHYFDQGLKQALLFVAKENPAALKVYESIGFHVAGDFVIAEY